MPETTNGSVASSEGTESFFAGYVRSAFGLNPMRWAEDIPLTVSRLVLTAIVVTGVVLVARKAL